MHCIIHALQHGLSNESLVAVFRVGVLEISVTHARLRGQRAAFVTQSTVEDRGSLLRFLLILFLVCCNTSPADLLQLLQNYVLPLNCVLPGSKASNFVY